MIRLTTVDGSEVWIAADRIVMMRLPGVWHAEAQGLVDGQGWIEVNVAPDTISDWIRRR